MLRSYLIALALGALAMLLVACGTLPSVAQVEQKFRREHPGYTVESVTYQIEGSRGRGDSGASEIRDEAVFRVVYRKPGDTRSHTYERRFGTVAEGWIEIPRKTRER
jgi:hypothetical protein